MAELLVSVLWCNVGRRKIILCKGAKKTWIFFRCEDTLSNVSGGGYSTPGLEFLSLIRLF